MKLNKLHPIKAANIERKAKDQLANGADWRYLVQLLNSYTFSVGDVFKFSFKGDPRYHRKEWWVKDGIGYLSLVVAYKDSDNIPWFYEIKRNGSLDKDNIHPLIYYMRGSIEMDPTYADMMLMGQDPHQYDPGEILRNKDAELDALRAKNTFARKFNKINEEKIGEAVSLGQTIKKLKVGHFIWMRFRWRNMRMYRVVNVYKSCRDEFAYMDITTSRGIKERVRATDFQKIRTLTLTEPLKIVPVRVTKPLGQQL